MPKTTSKSSNLSSEAEVQHRQMLQRFAANYFFASLCNISHSGVLGGVHIYAFSSFETGCSKVVLVKSVAAVAVGKNDIDFEMNVLCIKHHE